MTLYINTPILCHIYSMLDIAPAVSFNCCDMCFCTIFVFCFFLQNLDPDSPYQECHGSVLKLKMAISKGDKDAVETLLDGGKWPFQWWNWWSLCWKTRMILECVRLNRVGIIVILCLDRDGGRHQVGLRMVSSHVRCQRRWLRVSQTAVEQRRQRELQQRLERHGLLHSLALLICGRNKSCALYLWQAKASYNSVDYMNWMFSNRHGVSVMTVVNGECKSTKINTDNLRSSEGWQQCAKNWLIKWDDKEKNGYWTQNLIPIVYFYLNFMSLNSFHQLSKQLENKIYQLTKHHLPPEILLISTSVPPCTSCRLGPKVSYPSPPQRHLFSISSPASRQRSSDSSGRGTDTPHLPLLNGDDAREELLNKTNRWSFSVFYLMHISLPSERMRWNWRHLFMVWKKTPPSQQY